MAALRPALHQAVVRPTPALIHTSCAVRSGPVLRDDVTRTANEAADQYLLPNVWFTAPHCGIHHWGVPTGQPACVAAQHTNVADGSPFGMTLTECSDSRAVFSLCCADDNHGDARSLCSGHVGVRALIYDSWLIYVLFASQEASYFSQNYLS